MVDEELTRIDEESTWMIDEELMQMIDEESTKMIDEESTMMRMMGVGDDDDAGTTSTKTTEDLVFQVAQHPLMT